MKKLLALIALTIAAVSTSAQFQTPKLEVGLGYVFKHQEGFGIPRFTVGLNDMFKGLASMLRLNTAAASSSKKTGPTTTFACLPASTTATQAESVSSQAATF